MCARSNDTSRAQIAAREEALKERKKKKKLFFKKTKTGQPVLKARMQVLLEKIEKGMQ